MKKLLPIFALALVPFVIAEPTVPPVERCMPNLTQVDMCAQAASVADAWNKMGLPKPVGSSTLTKVEADGPVVIQHITMKFTEVELTKQAANSGMSLSQLRDNWSNIVAESIEKSGCDRDLFMAFVGLGGVYKYIYYYPNGVLFATIEQHHCPQDR